MRIWGYFIIKRGVGIVGKKNKGSFNDNSYHMDLTIGSTRTKKIMAMVIGIYDTTISR